MEKRLFNIFKTINVAKLTKTILKTIWKTLKQSVYFLKAVEFWPIFDIQISITLATFWEKLQNYTF